MPDEMRQPTASKGAALFDIIAFFGLVFLASLLGQFILVQQMGLSELATAIPLTLVIFLGLMALMRLRDLSFADLGLRAPRSFAQLALATIGILLTMMLVVAIVLPPVIDFTGERPDLSRLADLAGNLGQYLLVLVVIWITAAFAEEIFFRGFLMHRLAALFGSNGGGWSAAALIQALLFGIMHGYQGASGVIVTGMLGVIFGFGFVLAGRNLWPLILAHGLFDTMTVTQIYLSG